MGEYLECRRMGGGLLRLYSRKRGGVPKIQKKERWYFGYIVDRKGRGT